MLQPSLARRAAQPVRWRPFGWLAGVLAVALLAAWAIPPLLDASRYRAAIASVAAARLGRPVVIAGDIGLRLLPQAVLTASDVTLPDQGDGISAQVPALRLQLATLPLVAGRLMLRDLVLSAPVLRLPWAMPGGIGQSSRPHVPRPFAARIENGTLHVGRAVVTGITASIHGGPSATGAEPAADASPVAAFGAEGVFAAGGRIWRFTGALGAPDADDVSAVDVSVRGRGAAAETGGSLQATLADGTLQGRLRAGGPDLSLLLPASRQVWTAEAPFVADATRVEAGALALSLGGAPVEGALVLSLAGPARLEGRLHAAALDLDGWAALLGGSLEAAAASPLLHVNLSADTARLFGGDLQAVRATLVSDGRSIGLDDAEATLPGGARLTAARNRLVPASLAVGGGTALSGPARLSAPDLTATLAWLKPVAPALVGALAPQLWRRAELSATLDLRAGGVRLSGLSGHLDQSTVSGSLVVRAGSRPRTDANLTFDRLALDPWLDAAPPASSLAGYARPFTRIESGLQLAVGHALLRGLPMEAVSLDVRTGAGTLTVQHASAILAGARLLATGGAGADGRLTGALLSLDSPALDRLLALLPAGWRYLPGLWTGPGAVRVAADGPPEAVGLQVRADIGDLVLEADSTRDTTTGTAATTLTLRHPGAPRLLATAGLPQALGLPPGLETMLHWLDTGSLAVLTHVQEAPGRLTVRDFDLDAAALRMGGGLVIDWTAHSLTGHLDFDQLALPGALPGPSPRELPAGWSARLRLGARSLSLGARVLASGVAADLSAGDGAVRATGVSASVAGGRLDGEVAANLRTPDLTAILKLVGARIEAPLTGWPVDVVSGTLDAAASLRLAGAAWADLSGDVHASLQDGRLAGFDLAQFSGAAGLRSRAGRAAVRMSLAQGNSSGLAGAAAATIAHGRLVLASARLASADGAALLAGSADLAAGDVDLTLTLSPAAPATRSATLRLSGPWRAPEVKAARSTIVGPATAYGIRKRAVVDPTHM